MNREQSDALNSLKTHTLDPNVRDLVNVVLDLVDRTNEIAAHPALSIPPLDRDGGPDPIGTQAEPLERDERYGAHEAEIGGCEAKAPETFEAIRGAGRRYHEQQQREHRYGRVESFAVVPPEGFRLVPAALADAAEKVAHAYEHDEAQALFCALEHLMTVAPQPLVPNAEEKNWIEAKETWNDGLDSRDSDTISRARPRIREELSSIILETMTGGNLGEHVVRSRRERCVDRVLNLLMDEAAISRFEESISGDRDTLGYLEAVKAGRL